MKSLRLLTHFLTLCLWLLLSWLIADVAASFLFGR
jgi:hypothetical protein